MSLRNALGKLVCCVLAAASPLAQTRPVETPDAADQFVQALMERAGIPGVQAAVAIDGRQVWSGAYGLADLEQQVPVASSSRFRIGSVSKPITAAVLARLVDEGRIDLDSPIRRYVPAVASETMTVRHVAAHLSGVRNYRGAEFVNRSHFNTVGDAVKVFVADPLLSVPGEKFAYSSYNYTLLSAAIETASGRPYLEYLQRAVLQPLRMEVTVADAPGPLIPGRARGYEQSDGALINAPWVDNSNKWAAGGLLSSAEDLVRFAIGLTAPGYLSPESTRLLFLPQRTSTGAPVAYGTGWRTDPEGSRQVWHGGESMGARAFLFLDVESRSVVALTCNLGAAPFSEKDARDLLAVVAGMRRQNGVARVPPADVRR